MKIFFLKNKAFTLVELLISISIIAIISTAIIVSVNTSREKGRDVKKVNDITQIQIALENYKKIEGTYPDSLTAGEALIGSSSDIVFLEKVPDVSYSSNTCPNDSYSYVYNADTGKYNLQFCLENNIDDYLAGYKCALPEGIKNGVCSLLSINNNNPPDGSNGVAYSPYTFTASGGLAPYSFSISSGTLPTGLSLDSYGVLSGTPTIEGNYIFNIQVIDSLLSISSAQFSMAVLWGCGSDLVDSRNNKTYPTVQIGNQCWMAQNINIGARATQNNNSIIEKYCYSNLESNCDIYGGYYIFNEALQYSTTAPIQGICPTGWHVPSYNEWMILADYLKGTSTAGGTMKATGTTYWTAPNTGATNASGFKALPSGECAICTSNWVDIKDKGKFWSSSQSSTYNAWSIYLYYGSTKMTFEANSKTRGKPVRCLLNTP